MVVEIWSDVMCPFCYIGKKRFESALEQFSQKEMVQVIWKSFQLNPELETNPSLNAISHLADSKGWTKEYAQDATNNVVQMAKREGLQFNFNKAVVANSFNAHRLLQYAKTKKQGAALKERFLKAYFTEGKNIDDGSVLLQLAKEIGLNLAEVQAVINEKDLFANEVRVDIKEAKMFGIAGVPFFAIDRKFGISGAQDSSVILQALEHAYAESQKQVIE